MFNITTPPNGTPSKIEGELCFGRSCPLWPGHSSLDVERKDGLVYLPLYMTGLL